MIGLCLVLLLGGTPASAPPRPSQASVELSLHRAVVVPAEDLDQDAPQEEADEAPEPPAPGDLVPLRRAAVVRAPDPTKEH